MLLVRAMFGHDGSGAGRQPPLHEVLAELRDGVRLGEMLHGQPLRDAEHRRLGPSSGPRRRELDPWRALHGVRGRGAYRRS